jgi:hypothetical protein
MTTDTLRAYWAYAITGNAATLFPCETGRDAVQVKERLKGGQATRVGYLTRKLTEHEAQEAFRARGILALVAPRM